MVVWLCVPTIPLPSKDKLSKAYKLYTLLGLVYSKKIQKGDKIKCFGIGYPHWKGEIFECTLVFNDGTIGIKNCIRVSEQDFRVI